MLFALTLFWLLANCQSQRLECPPNTTGLAFKMLESNIGRDQGLQAGSGALGMIELGIFQQALRNSIARSDDEAQRQRWSKLLDMSTSSAIENLANATRDIEFPLDRLSVGTSMILQYQEFKNESYVPAIGALQTSVLNQPRNANGGLWYYNNVNNISAYHNLSYLDGMFSYAPFAVLSQATNQTSDAELLSASGALDQFLILHNITKRDDGLLVHGYDASKNHAWADPGTGASPVVWGRALAWYTLGLVNSLEFLLHQSSSSAVSKHLRKLFKDIIRAQLIASDRSLQIEGSYGVWQVVDHPGASFNGTKNFIEASATVMTAYSLLRGARLGLLDDLELKLRAQITGVGMFQTARQNFLIENRNGTLSYNGTSVVCTLSGNVDYSYYVTRPTALNALIGTSAFILASLEVEKLCSHGLSYY
ncbi:glycoside hydrolase family 105 protein [Pseudocercospora fijiensis CIRAD86]|uniref:Glycoside hydrolase family 105 protein n=1 Tax=Pseudocercospora fijiensis (strain CIRAD86) TaxID=383855 RepID=M3B6E5_PSEFD|nr:glycoside hydrolase family 105 protein [Pseudocercospora fijiensis CIRAD86]EME84937.1 glycoside hydrolase family 105 protein [Pseudocercospora fijiensis CIRAD86]